MMNVATNLPVLFQEKRTKNPAKRGGSLNTGLTIRLQAVCQINLCYMLNGNTERKFRAHRAYFFPEHRRKSKKEEKGLHSLDEKAVIIQQVENALPQGKMLTKRQ